MLSDGDIPATEYVGAVNLDVALWGLEKKEEYEVRPPSGISGVSPGFVALVLISNELLPTSTLQRVKQLMQARKFQEMIEVLKSGNPWLNEQLAERDEVNTSLQSLIQHEQAVLDKAQSLGVELPQKRHRRNSSNDSFLSNCRTA